MAENNLADEQTSLDVYDVLMTVVEQLSSIAWQKLGLQPDMMTGKISTHIEQAKVAIDATADLSKYIEGRLDESDRRTLQSLVRDLRINYVSRAKEAGG